MKLSIVLTALPWTAAAAAAATALRPKSHIVNQTTCGGTTYAYTGLEGYGFIPSNATDKYGDTIGGIGSSIAIEPDSWRRTDKNTYSGIVYALPDRGWNTNGTLNFQPRIHKIALTLTLARNASAQTPSPPNLHLKYLDTILLTGPDDLPTTGLDPDVTGAASYPGYPPLPAATYVGDGFGGEGPGGQRISLDPEGLAIDNDGGFWVSDEYGPYVYKFSKEGKMILAIQPPEAILPRRNGTLSFSAASPPVYNPELEINPEDPQSGRNNNQGLEALTISPDGKTLYTMMQSALNQEGGPKKKNRQPARLLEYDISSSSSSSSSGKPVYKHEYVVLLPKYEDYTKNESVVASQSEVHMLPTGDFLVLSRDSGFGHGQDETRSVYRHADVVSIGNSTTDLKGTYDSVGASVASSKGVLKDDITPVEYCSFLDYNVESELAKFGLHNGGPQDALLLNEKWESFALVPVEPEQHKRGSSKTEYFLFSFSDNDFMTQDGHMNFGRYKYADESGYNIDNQVLVFKVEF
ncbi:esterase-like activity of phytase-domain-containing protein [Aspergillus caelatus]|uniref:Esterase-like activity of phytase-domain-containing protein n=1 Tax=Aspergillus caelatus TaxID=61420 RepID=A0A5N6ZKX8_9EURO|nr:esterase-like activity of phytase-domain-containing protein [Aspergillus caelatus]KAE8357459.1 esterase-like activity of phytase-domain-containing protein [Aspergillus caelatus]